jgi:hypothetical protein
MTFGQALGLETHVGVHPRAQRTGAGDADEDSARARVVVSITGSTAVTRPGTDRSGTDALVTVACAPCRIRGDRARARGLDAQRAEFTARQCLAGLHALTGRPIHAIDHAVKRRGNHGSFALEPGPLEPDARGGESGACESDASLLIRWRPSEHDGIGCDGVHVANLRFGDGRFRFLDIEIERARVEPDERLSSSNAVPRPDEHSVDGPAHFGLEGRFAVGSHLPGGADGEHEVAFPDLADCHREGDRARRGCVGRRVRAGGEGGVTSLCTFALCAGEERACDAERNDPSKNQ